MCHGQLQLIRLAVVWTATAKHKASLPGWMGRVGSCVEWLSSALASLNTWVYSACIISCLLQQHPEAYTVCLEETRCARHSSDGFRGAVDLSTSQWMWIFTHGANQGHGANSMIAPIIVYLSIVVTCNSPHGRHALLAFEYRVPKATVTKILPPEAYTAPTPSCLQHHMNSLWPT